MPRPTDRNNAPTTVNPIYTRKPATPPPSGPGSMNTLGSGYVRPVPKPSAGPEPRSRQGADPYGYTGDFDEDDLDDDEFNELYNENN